LIAKHLGNQRSITYLSSIRNSSSANTEGDSSRSFTVGKAPLLSGTDKNSYTVVTSSFEDGTYPKVKFNQKVSSAFISGDDDIKLKFFGMGDAFSGQIYNNSLPL
jgi:hypothetical protein